MILVTVGDLSDLYAGDDGGSGIHNTTNPDDVQTFDGVLEYVFALARI